jgi:hypothetical protein
MERSYTEEIRVVTEEGPLNGYAEHTFPDGRNYCGYWKNGFPHGQGAIDEYDCFADAVPDATRRDAALAAGEAFISETFRRQ